MKFTLVDTLPAPCLKTLDLCKKAQRDEHSFFQPLSDNNIYHLTTPDANSINRGEYVDIPEDHQAVFDTAIMYLIKHDYIQRANDFDNTILQVTLEGWYHKDLTKMERNHLLLTNVICPLLVALVTTIITLFLNYLVTINQVVTNVPQ